ncbi:MAG: hypothetical protein RIB84_08540 [Sneathiellaceae bacterium]
MIQGLPGAIGECGEALAGKVCGGRPGAGAVAQRRFSQGVGMLDGDGVENGPVAHQMAPQGRKLPPGGLLAFGQLGQGRAAVDPQGVGRGEPGRMKACGNRHRSEALGCGPLSRCQRSDKLVAGLIFEAVDTARRVRIQELLSGRPAPGGCPSARRVGPAPGFTLFPLFRLCHQRSAIANRR